MNSLDNVELNLASEYVRDTGCNIFLTGKAGTGKTTFLRNLKKNSAKRMIVTAPTGVAAINAGGVTLHSFFQLPFGPFVPGSECHERNGQRKFKFSQEKKQIIKNLDVLIIDEISMVRADLLDSVDAVLRRHRANDLPFGGIQILMIGDLYQLPPVVKFDEWEVLKYYYSSAYFFSSTALNQTELITIELKHIYRQSDVHFIDFLNRIRNNRLDSAAIGELNKRYMAHFKPREEEGYITLTTHNESADRNNHNRLAALTGSEYPFDAEISGDFPEHAYPAPGTLVLKKGAQVMFLRNDSSPERRYFNGKIGKIIGLNQEIVRILCSGESEEIVVEPITWENIKYSVNRESNEIEEETIGTFKQYPLKPAWAITIHKSQGLTFEKAVIDVQSAFTHGQVYVALSRCKTFNGLVLSSPFPSQGIKIDRVVLDFINRAREHPPSKAQLLEAKKGYFLQLLCQCFDLKMLYGLVNRLVQLLQSYAHLIQITGENECKELEKIITDQAYPVSEKFQSHLSSIINSVQIPHTDTFVKERVIKASLWFKEVFVNFRSLVHKVQVAADNQYIDKKINTVLNDLKREITLKEAGIQSCEKGFIPTLYLRALTKAEAGMQQAKSKKSKASYFFASDIKNQELFQQLKEWRTSKADKLKIAQSQVMHHRVLMQIAAELPQQESDLKRIKGVGKKTLKKYGRELLTLVVNYYRKKVLERPVLSDINKKNNKKRKSPSKATSISNTKLISFNMFKKGLTISRIAKERGLAESTIQGHLGHFIEQRELDINKVLSPEKHRIINEILAKVPNNSMKDVKQKLGENYSYGEIRLVLAHQNAISR